MATSVTRKLDFLITAKVTFFNDWHVLPSGQSVWCNCTRGFLCVWVHDERTRRRDADFPGSEPEPVRRLNRRAHEGFHAMGVWAIALMVLVCLACVPRRHWCETQKAMWTLDRHCHSGYQPRRRFGKCSIHSRLAHSDWAANWDHNTFISLRQSTHISILDRFED
jgi:hypothetical protein